MRRGSAGPGNALRVQRTPVSTGSYQSRRRMRANRPRRSGFRITRAGLGTAALAYLTMGLPLTFMGWLAWQVGARAPDLLAIAGTAAIGATGVWLYVAPRHGDGFRHCGRPICQVSRHNVVWPSEYRVEVPVWGRVHLACFPTPTQLAHLRRMAAMQRAAASFAVHLAQLRTGFERTTQAMQALSRQLPREGDDP
jgi:hypothetical protein